jgi:hypothetical protein
MSTSNNPPLKLKLLFEEALNEFDKRALPETNLIQHKIVEKLKKCKSANSVIDVLREQAQDFRDYREKGGVIMDCLKPVVQILHTLSTSSVLGGAINLGLVCVRSLD